MSPSSNWEYRLLHLTTSQDLSSAIDFSFELKTD